MTNHYRDVQADLIRFQHDQELNELNRQLLDVFQNAEKSQARGIINHQGLFIDIRANEVIEGTKNLINRIKVRQCEKYPMLFPIEQLFEIEGINVRGMQYEDEPETISLSAKTTSDGYIGPIERTHIRPMYVILKFEQMPRFVEIMNLFRRRIMELQTTNQEPGDQIRIAVKYQQLQFEYLDEMVIIDDERTPEQKRVIDMINLCIRRYRDNDSEGSYNPQLCEIVINRKDYKTFYSIYLKPPKQYAYYKGFRVVESTGSDLDNPFANIRLIRN